MLILNLYGTIRQKNRLEEFAEDVLNELFPQEPQKDWIINIRFCRKLDAMGYCEMVDNAIEITILNQKSIDDVATTIAHELVHAKQFIKGQLNEEMTRWCKEKIPYGPRGGCKIRYSQQPWEREAFEAEKWLTELYWEV